MVIPVELTPAQEQRLRTEAQRLGLSPEDLARLAVEDLLDRPETDFEEAARHVLQKNHELYERLS
jgi:hypothetical protein